MGMAVCQQLMLVQGEVGGTVIYAGESSLGGRISWES